VCCPRLEYGAASDRSRYGRTSRLVTSAALILFLAFVPMASGPQTDVKVFRHRTRGRNRDRRQ
jgi:hypothetical protein